MKLFDSKGIQALDRAAVRKYGIKGLQLMENAGRAVAAIVLREMEGLRLSQRVAIVAGKGNNGGDGFVAARHLKNSGIPVSVFLAGRLEEMKGDAALNAKAWLKMGGEVNPVNTEADLKKAGSVLRHSPIIIDALFGTGLNTSVAGIYASIISYINTLGKKVISVDIPSGIDATTGAVLGTAVRADITATMAAPKIGLYVLPGRDYAGKVEVVDIGAPRELTLTDDERISCNLITDDFLRRTLRPRHPNAHKGALGHLVIIAGSPGMTGAAYMAGTAAMRSGAGLATIALPESLNPIMEIKTAEIMTKPLPETGAHTLGPVSYDAVKKFIEGKSAVVAGPGLGASKDVDSFIEMLIDGLSIPAVIDASALNAVAKNPGALKKLKAGVVLTPHPGEMSRLLRMPVSEVQKDRLGAARKLAEKTGAVVVLKGAATIVADKEGRTYINPTGNPGLATAGTGDILAGMIGGLLAQGYGLVESACASTYIHGLAGDEVKSENGEAGMMATDLLPHIPRLINTFTHER